MSAATLYVDELLPQFLLDEIGCAAPYTSASPPSSAASSLSSSPEAMFAFRIDAPEYVPVPHTCKRRAAQRLNYAPVPRAVQPAAKRDIISEIKDLPKPLRDCFSEWRRERQEAISCNDYYRLRSVERTMWTALANIHATARP